jgi:hypothetical protein
MRALKGVRRRRGAGLLRTVPWARLRCGRLCRCMPSDAPRPALDRAAQAPMWPSCSAALRTRRASTWSWSTARAATCSRRCSCTAACWRSSGCALRCAPLLGGCWARSAGTAPRGTLFLVPHGAQHVAGSSRVQPGPPPLPPQVIAPLLRILEKMHALKLLHRDIKPENIFLTGLGKFKLVRQGGGAQGRGGLGRGRRAGPDSAGPGRQRAFLTIVGHHCRCSRPGRLWAGHQVRRGDPLQPQRHAGLHGAGGERPRELWGPRGRAGGGQLRVCESREASVMRLIDCGRGPSPTTPSRPPPPPAARC